MKARHWYLVLYMADLACLLGALFLADWAKRHLPFGQPVPEGTRFVTPLLVAFLLGLWTFYARLAQIYIPRGPFLPGLELRRLAGTLVFTGITFTGLVFLLKYHQLSRLLLLYFGTLALLFLATYRMALWGAWRRLLKLGYGVRRVVVAGCGELAQQIAALLEREPWATLQFLGFLEDYPPPGLRTLGTLQDAERVVREHQVDEVVVALGEGRRRQVLALVHALQWSPVRVKVVPDYLELATVRASIQDLAGIPLLELRPPVVEGFDALVKRAVDLLGAALGLALLWPLMLLIALAIKPDSAGPIFFRQVRVGENGRLFTLLKFRTMRVGAPPVPPVPSTSEDIGRATLKWGPDNPYVTRVGRLLRRFSLDELPQLWNVLKGEMSLVGPRPEVPDIVRLYKPWHLKRLAVKPGLSGPMQVNGRSELTLDERVGLELAYMQHYSLWEDLKLLAKTLLAVVSAKGAR